MLSRYILLLAIWLLLLTSCKTTNSSISSTSTPKVNLELVVYRQAVATLYPDCTSFLVFKKTNNNRPNFERLFDLSNTDSVIVDNYFTQNEKTHFINEDLQLHGEVTFTTWMELRNKYPSNDPQDNLGLNFVALRSDYPEVCGILEFSMVGFNDTFDEALVTVTLNEKYGACYEISIVLLIRTGDDTWSVKDKGQGEVCS